MCCVHLRWCGGGANLKLGAVGHHEERIIALEGHLSGPVPGLRLQVAFSSGPSDISAPSARRDDR